MTSSVREVPASGLVRRRVGGPIASAILLLGLVASGCAVGSEAKRVDRKSASPTETNVSATGDVSEPLVRGIAWLVANQNGDGSWGSFESARPSEIYLGTVASHRAFKDATSALATMALIPAAERGDREAMR